MNPYLATCHVLATLGQPTTHQDFQEGMTKNPFFKNDCVTLKPFLETLLELGVIEKRQHQYVLSAYGKRFENHILQWNQYSPQAQAQRITRQKKPSIQQQKVQKQCPACKSVFCGLYLFIILYERFQWGHLETEPAVNTGLFECLTPPFLRFYLWDHTLSAQDCNSEEKQFLKQYLNPHVDKKFLQTFATRHVQNAPKNQPHIQSLPYLQFRYKIMPPQLLKEVSALRHPILAPFLDPLAPSQLGLVQTAPIYFKTEKRQEALWLVRYNHRLQIIHLLKKEKQWHQKHVEKY